jgi:hypothetical protein
VAANRVRAIARADTAVARAAVTVEEATAAGASVAAIPVGPVVAPMKADTPVVGPVVDPLEADTPVVGPVVDPLEADTPVVDPVVDRTEAATPAAAGIAMVAATPAQAMAIRGTETSAPSAA